MPFRLLLALALAAAFGQDACVAASAGLSGGD
jgi:hypothetical protein